MIESHDVGLGASGRNARGWCFTSLTASASAATVRWKLLYINAPLAPLPPEPCRYLGFQASYAGMKILEWLERLRPSTRGDGGMDAIG